MNTTPEEEPATVLPAPPTKGGWEERSRERLQGDAPEEHQESTRGAGSTPETDAWIAEQATAREAQHDRRKAWLRQAHEERQEARRHGLRARHAEKLRRLRNQEEQP